MKLKFLLPALLAAFVGFSSPAFAQDTDMATIKCSEFLKSNQNDMTMLIFWIDGYISAQSDNTVISDEWMTKLGTHLGSYCATNPNNTIMQAIEAME